MHLHLLALSCKSFHRRWNTRWVKFNTVSVAPVRYSPSCVCLWLCTEPWPHTLQSKLPASLWTDVWCSQATHMIRCGGIRTFSPSSLQFLTTSLRNFNTENCLSRLMIRDDQHQRWKHRWWHKPTKTISCCMLWKQHGQSSAFITDRTQQQQGQTSTPQQAKIRLPERREKMPISFRGGVNTTVEEKSRKLQVWSLRRTETS